MTCSSEQDQAAMEAAHWLVALDDDPHDLELRVRFQAWLDATPANATAWKNIADIDELLGRFPAEYEAHWRPYQADRAVKRTGMPGTGVWASSSAKARWPRCRHVLFGVLVSAVAACFAVFMTPAVLLRIEADQITSTGELRSVRLVDGSTVQMGPDSAIALGFADGRRGVRLLKGEAFFEVAPDLSRPFQVRTGAIVTTVLGTAFDVRLEKGGVAVAVRNGRVQVDHALAGSPVSQQLEAGQWTRVTWAGDSARGRIRSEDIAAWIDGQIVARDRPLSDVIDDLRRYYGGLIVLTDTGFGRQRVTGVYNVADPAKALRAMVGAYGGSARQVSPWILVVSGP